MSPSLLAVSDLHLDHPDNWELVEGMEAGSPRDWLILCGDVAERPRRLERALSMLRERFDLVAWVPGNHELLTYSDEAPSLRGEARYRHLVELCRRLGVVTPEDPFPIWEGPAGPVRVAPLFLLYDYSFGRNIAPTPEAALRRAHEAGVVCVDEYLLHPDPYPSRQAWCKARVDVTAARLEREHPELPTVLVNHFPLLSAPTEVLRHPEFAQWCGTVDTAEWHLAYNATVVVYGHLHIPRTTWHDGVRFEEVSLGYPRERSWRPWPWPGPRRILGEPRHA